MNSTRSRFISAPERNSWRLRRKITELRGKVTSILSDRMTPQRSTQLEDALQEGRLAELSSQITPADTFYLTAEFRRRFPGEIKLWGAAGQELVDLSRQDPAELSWERLSQDFGVPHPIVARHLFSRIVEPEAVSHVRRVFQPTAGRNLGFHESVLGPLGR